LDSEYRPYDKGDLYMFIVTGEIRVKVERLSNITARVQVCTVEKRCNILYEFKVQIYCNPKSTTIKPADSLKSVSQTFYINKRYVPYFYIDDFVSEQAECPVISYRVYETKNLPMKGWKVFKDQGLIKFEIPE